MAEITIEGTVFCVAGILSDYDSHAQAEDAIKAAGGRVSKSIGVKTQVLVLGSNTSTQMEKARSRGIHVIRERQLEQLLAGETVHVRSNELPTGNTSMEKLIGDARSILDGHPGAGMWERITKLVDSCSPDQQSELVDYLEPHVSRWSFDYDAQWRASEYTHACKGMPNRWNQFMPFGELRVAPFQWAVAMAGGDASPKYRLVHAIHTRDMELSATMLTKIVSCPTLTNLRSLGTDSNKVSKTFFKKLRAAPGAHGLEFLRLSRMDMKTITGIDGEHEFGRLRELFIDTEYSTKQDALRHLLCSEAMSGVEVLTFSSGLDKVLDCFDTEEALPNLRTLRMSWNYEDYIKALLRHPIVERVGHVQVSPPWSAIANPGAFQRLTARAEHLVELDLSYLGMETRVDVAVTDESVEELYGTLSAWTAPERLETLTLGRWYDEARAEELAETLGVRVAR